MTFNTGSLSKWFRILSIAFIGLLFGQAGRTDEGVRLDLSTKAQMAQDISYLSSDELEGRGVGGKGIEKAADFIAARFRDLGLKTNLFENTPFQKFSITVDCKLSGPELNDLRLEGPQGASVLNLGGDYSPLAIGGSGKVDTEVVFAGYGISAPEYQYDDYAGLDVKGKVVVILRKEPDQANPNSVFDGTKNSSHATFMRKIANAREHEVAGVILVNDYYSVKSAREQARRSALEAISRLTAASEEAVGILGADSSNGPTASEAKEKERKALEKLVTLAQEVQNAGSKSSADNDELVPFKGAGEGRPGQSTPVWFASRAAIDAMVTASIGQNLAALEERIDEKGQPQSAKLEGWRVRGQTDMQFENAEIKNVVGVLEGSGELASETIVIGAHYDHIGFGGAESLAPWTHEIHNGADDNASGVVALLDIAKRLANRPEKTRRRIVFIAFTGEEKGLLGSARYCEQPLVPLDSTIAMLNLDMVGRMEENKLIVYGSGVAKEFDPLLDELGRNQGFSLTKHEGGFGPSDHASFYAKKIPVLHFFTGTHPDYHRPSDDSDKVNVEGMQKVAEFVTSVAERIDSTTDRPTYVEIQKHEMISDGGDRPYFGSIPDYSKEDGKGLAITGVVPIGPAAMAGLQGGDVITKLGESRITGIEDFDSALRKHKPGDKVNVEVLRGSEKIVLEIVLGKRPSR